MARAGCQKIGQNLIYFFVGLSLFVFTSTAGSSHLSPQEVRTTVQESMAAILTGKKYSPSLARKQLALRSMFENGAITKPQLQAISEEVMIPLLDRHQTSRYILQDAGKRVNDLLSPYMNWEEVKDIAWKVGASMVPDGEQVVLKIGTLAPPGTPWLTIPEKVLLPRIARLSDNKFKVKIFGGGVMGEDTDILRKMDIGQLDGCGCTALGILAASPETSVFLLPGMYRNYEEIDYISKKFRKQIDQAFEKKGYILGSFIDTGFFYIFTRNKVASLNDLRKQTFGTWFGNIETTLFDELGFNGHPVAVPETISAYSTGMVNANIAPAAWMLGMQAYQYVNFYIKNPLLYSPGAIIISLKTKERLRKRFGVSDTFATNVQEMLTYEVSSIEEEWKKLSREYEDKCLQAFEQKCGIKVVELSAEDRKIIEQAALEVQDMLADKVYPRGLMNDIRKALQAYRAHRR